MKLSVSITHPRGKSLPRELVSTAWGHDGLTVPDALRRLADELEVPAVVNRDGETVKPARGIVENVTVWIERTDR